MRYCEILIDSNLPYYFSIWNNPDYIHQNDIDPASSDQKIWNYARANDLTIVTKDADFSNLILFKDPPPKIIQRIGKTRLSEFYSILKKCWNDVLQLSETHKLVIVFNNQIQGVK